MLFKYTKECPSFCTLSSLLLMHNVKSELQHVYVTCGRVRAWTVLY